MYNIESFDVFIKIIILHFKEGDIEMRWLYCPNAQTGLRLCCSHKTKVGFLVIIQGLYVK